LALKVKSPDQLVQKLRQHNPPIIARTQENRILFDPRTVLDEQQPALLKGLRDVFGA
jgi:L-seryl-tRNA(Ser) seleniumtransferase